MSTLLDLVRGYGPLTAAEAARIDAAWAPTEEVPPGTVLLAQGRICRSQWFLEAGLVRFYAEPDGRDATRHFVLPGMVFTAYPSLESGRPSAEGLQALAASRLRRISREGAARLAAGLPVYDAFRRAYMREVYAYLDAALDAARWQTAAARYAAFERDSPEILHAAPLHTVASYLGMTPQSLSRIRRAHVG